MLLCKNLKKFGHFKLRTSIAKISLLGPKCQLNKIKQFLPIPIKIKRLVLIVSRNSPPPSSERRYVTQGIYLTKSGSYIYAKCI
jgi:hypothetical protein